MRKEIPTNYFIKRHGEKSKVVKLVVEGNNDLVGKIVTLKKDSKIFSIVGNELTEKVLRRAEDGFEFYVENVLATKTEFFHASTWNQNTNIFLVNKNEYVHFGSAENITDSLKIGLRETKKVVKAETSGIVTKILLFGLLAYVITKVIEKKL